jgi:hypothetical protein
MKLILSKINNIVFIPILGIFLLFAIASGSNKSDCSGHESEIESGYRQRAAKMGMTINYINIKYIGNCQYEVSQNTYDPGSTYSSSQTISGTSIYTWK